LAGRVTAHAGGDGGTGIVENLIKTGNKLRAEIEETKAAESLRRKASRRIVPGRTPSGSVTSRTR
jgi:hypothetical protein